eukprot:10874179-Ditylum_brightwellii.AAC.1
MVIPSQSKREQGAGKKEPAIQDLCNEIRRDAAGASSHCGSERSPQTGEHPLGKRGSPAISRM